MEQDVVRLAVRGEFTVGGRPCLRRLHCLLGYFYPSTYRLLWNLPMTESTAATWKVFLVSPPYTILHHSVRANVATSVTK